MLILLTHGCCWAPLCCLFPRGFTKCGSAFHPSVFPAQLEVQSAEAAPEVGEASLLRAGLDSKCSAVMGLWVRALFIPVLFLERCWMLEPLLELLEQHLLHPLQSLFVV